MIAVIHPSSISGRLAVPASKSVMQRVCALALLHPGQTIIRQPGHSRDDIAALNIIAALGAEWKEQDHQICVRGPQHISANRGWIDCGESGLSARMFTLLAALSDRPTKIQGSGTLTGRDMRFFDEWMPQLGVSFRSNGGRLPFEVTGPMQFPEIRVNGSSSSQYISGLLLAYGAGVQRTTQIVVDQPASRPYLDLTVTYMRKFGYRIDEEPGPVYQIHPRTIPAADPITCTVEGDWSSASFWLAAAAHRNNQLVLEGLDDSSLQADRAMLGVLDQIGVLWEVRADGIHCWPPERLRPFQFDATQAPDLFPPLVALAAGISEPCAIRGTHRLINKESNRLQSLLDVFSRLGVQIQAGEDTLLVQRGNLPTEPVTVSSHRDHRIAMAVSIWALHSGAAVRITEAEAVEKSYPDFYSDLRKLGATVFVE